MVAGTGTPRQSWPAGRTPARSSSKRRPWLIPPAAKAVLLFKGRIYIRPMFKFEFCLPTRATVVPAAPEWFHEIKFDGYRLRIERDGARVGGKENFIIDQKLSESGMLLARAFSRSAPMIEASPGT